MSSSSNFNEHGRSCFRKMIGLDSSTRKWNTGVTIALVFQRPRKIWRHDDATNETGIFRDPSVLLRRNERGGTRSLVGKVNGSIPESAVAPSSRTESGSGSGRKWSFLSPSSHIGKATATGSRVVHVSSVHQRRGLASLEATQAREISPR